MPTMSTKVQLLVCAALLFPLPALLAQDQQGARPDLPRGNKAVWALTVATAATGALDIEATQHCVALGTCHEANTLLAGQDRPVLYLVKGLSNVSTTCFGYWLHKYARNPAVRKLWWLPQGLAIGANLYGASTGIRYWGRARR